MENLHDRDEYVEYRTVRLSGIMLTIIVRTTLQKHIHNSSIHSVARGILNAWGNKGGVAVSLEFRQSNICFVNSHLAAKDDNVVERNEDYKAIEQGIRFEEDGGSFRTISDHK